MDFMLECLVNVIGAFVGFGLAMMLQFATEKKQRNSKLSQVLKSINEELYDISESLKEYIKLKQPLMQKITTPAWETAVHSGIVLELIEFEELYKTMIHAYSLIGLINDGFANKYVQDIHQIMSEVLEESEKVAWLSQKLHIRGKVVPKLV